MDALCGADCSTCGFKASCKGCEETCGSPFGGRCVAAECIKAGGRNAFLKLKEQIVSEFNALKIRDMPKITRLDCLCGFFVNLEYPLASGAVVKFLDDRNIYLGTQVAGASEGRCFGLVADTGFLLVCEYGENGADPEIVLYKRR
jgi:hypothetical protein